MRRQLSIIVSVFVIFLLWGIVQKPLFLICYSSLSAVPVKVTDWCDVIAAGLPLDLAVASYLTVIPAVLATSVSVFDNRRLVLLFFKCWFWITAVVLSIITVTDLTLYSYWGFRLDATPVFYFISSPSAAVASASVLQIITALLLIAVISVVIYTLLYKSLVICLKKFGGSKVSNWKCWTVLSVILLLLFFGIRGSVTVSTMNLSRAYYSNNTLLNHAATNPAFSLIYSLSHQDDFGNQFRNMQDEEACAVSETFYLPVDSAHVTNGIVTIGDTMPDIYVVILESFSAHLFPSLGGEPVAVKLDSLAKTGIEFTNFYANSFRTDRGIPAIVSAFPGVPTASLMKFVNKTANMPSIASELSKHGYRTAYYYGGDINFTNQLAYLRNAEFEEFVSDKDFPLSQRTGKWGAHDHILFDKVADMVEKSGLRQPYLRVIQTSSSHEPFEVPFKSRFENSRLNAFAYADSCAAAFAECISKIYSGHPWIMLFVADHFGAYPKHPEGALAKHHIPFFIIGNCIAEKGIQIDKVGSQADIAVTVLSLFDDASETFPFGNDLFSSNSGGAFISRPDFYGWVGDDGYAVIDANSGKTVENNGENKERQARAYIQLLYDYLNEL